MREGRGEKKAKHMLLIAVVFQAMIDFAEKM